MLAFANDIFIIFAIDTNTSSLLLLCYRTHQTIQELQNGIELATSHNYFIKHIISGKKMSYKAHKPRHLLLLLLLLVFSSLQSCFNIIHVPL